jgi:hypothetical protein
VSSRAQSRDLGSRREVQRAIHSTVACSASGVSGEQGAIACNP